MSLEADDNYHPASLEALHKSISGKFAAPYLPPYKEGLKPAISAGRIGFFRVIMVLAGNLTVFRSAAK